MRNDFYKGRMGKGQQLLWLLSQCCAYIHFDNRHVLRHRSIAYATVVAIYDNITITMTMPMICYCCYDYC
uniref:Uncharacterized protein n=1 Tax=Rhizophora mucronata TaxID=61149 RepID=A0A2P2R2I3_RHIMU